MCGIAGLFAHHPSAGAVDRTELRRIRDHMAARGPDGSGEWYSADGRIGLGHRRLAIIDLSERGAQPMASADGEQVVTFNGEIYNYRALRRELEARGRRFRSDSDTEVLLHLYAEKGAALVEDLRGMFAFALWDGRRRGLLLARDPYGIKPLYYTAAGPILRFASQVRALLAGGGVAKELDPAGETGFYLFGSVPEPFTLYRDIRALPAGCTLWVDEGGPGAPKPYFSVAEVLRQAMVEPVRLGPEALQTQVREALLDSVRHHLVADVPVGAFLSAGVDSGALVGLMRDAGQADIRTVTLTFAEFRGRPDDEAPLAERVAARYGTRHVTRVVGEAEFRTDLPLILEAMDQPSIDGINTWFASKAAREQGLKVAVSGLGGDELFGGYPSFRDLPRWVRWLGPPARIPGLGRALRRLGGALLAPYPRFTARVSPKLASLLEYGGDYPGAYLLRRGLFMPWELPGLLGVERARAGLARLRPLEYIGSMLEPDPGTPFGRVAALEAALYMRNQLLRDADWAGMAHSLEIRVPLVDAGLLRRLAPLLEQRAAAGGKSLLANSPDDPLPGEHLRRAKTGFQTPIAGWLERLPVAVNGKPHRHWSRKWALWVLDNKSGHLPPPPEVTPARLTPHPSLLTLHPLRILALIPDAFGGHGGIAQYNRDFLTALCRDDRVAEVVAIPRVVPNPLEPLPDKLVFDVTAAGGTVRYLTRVAKVLLAPGSFDLVCCGHIHLLPLAWVIARLLRKPVWLLIYGIEVWQPTSRWLVNRLVGRVTGVISISEVTLSRFVAWSGCPRERCDLVPNAIHLTEYGVGPKPGTLIERYGLAGRTVLMTFGRLASEERAKGFDEILELLPKLVQDIPDVAYVIAGDGADRKRLEGKVRALGLTERVVFTGRVAEREKADLYRLADAYVMPSRGEGFGFVLLEAMACGVPVAASRIDGGREALRDGELGILVDPYDPDDIRRGILAALDQPRQVPAGLDYFSFDRFVGRVRVLLDRVARREV